MMRHYAGSWTKPSRLSPTTPTYYRSGLRYLFREHYKRRRTVERLTQLGARKGQTSHMMDRRNHLPDLERPGIQSPEIGGQVEGAQADDLAVTTEHDRQDVIGQRDPELVARLPCPVVLSADRYYLVEAHAPPPDSCRKWSHYAGGD
jgi:hypothetical protein